MDGVPFRTTGAPAPLALASARIARVFVETERNAASAPAGAVAPVARASSSAVKSGSVADVASLCEGAAPAHLVRPSRRGHVPVLSKARGCLVRSMRYSAIARTIQLKFS